MHELALARNMIEIVQQYASENGPGRVKKISIRLGELSAMSRALHFCFGAASRGTLCEGATLHIEEIPLTVYCQGCNENKLPIGRYSFRCMDCGMPTPKIMTGKEMELVSIELSQRADDRTLNPDMPAYQQGESTNFPFQGV